MTKQEILAQIEVLKEETKKLEELANKSEKFEFEFTPYHTYMLETHTHYETCSVKEEEYIRHGRYRLTEEGAQLSLERNCKANRLEMLAEYLDGLKEFKEGEKDWYVFYDYHYKKWVTGGSSTSFFPETVYMTREIATKIANMLNNGEYEL